MGYERSMSVLETTYKGSPIWAIALTLVVPAIVTHMSLYPSTRSIRMGHLPLGVYGMWIMLTSYNITRPDDIQLFELSMLFTLSAGIRYAFTKTPPAFHPLPRQPPLAFIRNNQIFKTFNLLASEFRHINILPSPSLPLRTELGGTRRGYFSSILYHLTHAIFHITLMDLLLYPAYILDPTGVGSAHPPGGGDLMIFCQRVGGRWWWLIWGWMGFAIAAATMVAMMGTYHLFALVCVGSGVWIDEEWPDFMDEPWKADSINDLWGKRYHQMLRDLFILWSTPFSSLPKPFYILSIFLSSALFHILIYYPMTKEIIITPYLSFYLLQGVGCILERALYKVSGRRVGGWRGRIWMWGWVMCTGWGMIGEYYRIGWVGMMRAALVQNGMSPAQGLGSWLGIEPEASIEI